VSTYQELSDAIDGGETNIRVTSDIVFTNTIRNIDRRVAIFGYCGAGGTEGMCEFTCQAPCTSRAFFVGHSSFANVGDDLHITMKNLRFNGFENTWNAGGAAVLIKFPGGTGTRFARFASCEFVSNKNNNGAVSLVSADAATPIEAEFDSCLFDSNSVDVTMIPASRPPYDGETVASAVFGEYVDVTFTNNVFQDNVIEDASNVKGTTVAIFGGMAAYDGNTFTDNTSDWADIYVCYYDSTAVPPVGDSECDAMAGTIDSTAVDFGGNVFTGTSNTQAVYPAAAW